MGEATWSMKGFVSSFSRLLSFLPVRRQNASLAREMERFDCDGHDDSVAGGGGGGGGGDDDDDDDERSNVFRLAIGSERSTNVVYPPLPLLRIVAGDERSRKR